MDFFGTWQSRNYCLSGEKDSLLVSCLVQQMIQEHDVKWRASCFMLALSDEQLCAFGEQRDDLAASHFYLFSLLAPSDGLVVCLVLCSRGSQISRQVNTISH